MGIVSREKYTWTLLCYNCQIDSYSRCSSQFERFIKNYESFVLCCDRTKENFGADNEAEEIVTASICAWKENCQSFFDAAKP
jgi:hypothetical protein